MPGICCTVFVPCNKRRKTQADSTQPKSEYESQSQSPSKSKSQSQNPNPCQSNPIAWPGQAKPNQTSSMEIRMPIFERLQLICNVFHCCVHMQDEKDDGGIKFVLIISIAFVRRSALCSPSNDSCGGIKNVIHNRFNATTRNYPKIWHIVAL